MDHVPALGFWAIFFLLVTAILIVDLGFLHRRAHRMSLAASGRLAGLYAGVAVAFGLGVWLVQGAEQGATYFTAYVVEQSLSMDNVFVMSVIFGYFAVPPEYRHRVLFWGVLGAIVFRGILLAFGATAVAEFHWLLLVFGALLVFTGLKLFFVSEEEEFDADKNLVLKWLGRLVPMTKTVHGTRFFVREPDATGRAVLHATPLFSALVAIEVSDLVFAVDSIPAVLAISQDTFIVYTSNVFAILNLRALYFVIDALVAKCRFLKPALSMILIFIGAKIFYATFVGHVNPVVSLSVTLSLLAGAIALSLVIPTRGPDGERQEAPAVRQG